MSIGLQLLDDSQHLLIVDLVVLLWQLELATMECDRVEYSVIGIALRNDSAEGIVGGVCFEYGGECGIKMAEDWSGGEGRPILFECGLGSVVPVEFATLLQKRCHWRGEFTEVLNEAAVEVGKTQKDSDVVHRFGHRPCSDRADLSRIHLHPVRPDDVPQESHFLLMKLALARL